MRARPADHRDRTARLGAGVCAWRPIHGDAASRGMSRRAGEHAATRASGRSRNGRNPSAPARARSSRRTSTMAISVVAAPHIATTICPLSPHAADVTPDARIAQPCRGHRQRLAARLALPAPERSIEPGRRPIRIRDGHDGRSGRRSRGRSDRTQRARPRHDRLAPHSPRQDQQQPRSDPRHDGDHRPAIARAFRAARRGAVRPPGRAATRSKCRLPSCINHPRRSRSPACRCPRWSRVRGRRVAGRCRAVDRRPRGCRSR